MHYARSNGFAHASLSLDVSVAAIQISHPNPISPYTTLLLLQQQLQQCSYWTA